MESSCKLHFYVIVIATWCHVLSFAIKILCDLSKINKPYNKSHLVIIAKT
jgi:hypothetical protein